MYSLKRTEVDKFKIDEAASLDELEENKDNQIFLNSKILSMEKVFENLPKIILDNKKENLFLNGVKLKINLADGIYNIYSEKYVGLGIIENRKFKKRCCDNLK